MPNLILKNKKAQPQTYEDIKKISIPTAEGGTAKFYNIDGNIAGDEITNLGSIERTLDTTNTQVNVEAGYTEGVSVQVVPQTKTVTPTEATQTAEADAGKVLKTVTVNPISKTYVGSEIPRKDSDDLTANGATVTTPAGYYAADAQKTIASGVLNNTATTGVTYAENTNAGTVIPSEGSLYINAGYYPDTKITLSHMIPDPEAGKANPGTNEIRSGYVAYDGAGKKVAGTMADVNPTFTGGAASLTGTSNTITPSSNIETATTSDYYIDATAKAKATRTAVTYNGNYTGYLDKATGTMASSANTSAEGSIAADRVYIKKATASKTDATVTTTETKAPTATTSVNGMVTSATDTGYSVTANAASGKIKASVTASSITVGAGYTEGVSTSTVADTKESTEKTASSTTYIQKGVLGASVSGNITFTPSVSTNMETIAKPSTGTEGTDYYSITGSGSKSGTVTGNASVSTEGYVKSETATGGSASGNINSDAKKYIPKGAIAASGSVTTSGSGSVNPGTNTISTNTTNTNVSVGTKTTTKPTSGFYVAVDAQTAQNTGSISVSGTGTASATVSTAGYVPTTVTGSGSVSGSGSASVTVPAKSATTTYIPITKGALGAQVSSNTSGSASMSAGGFTASSTATDYYVNLATTAGSVKAKATVGTEGYVKSETAETAATSVSVSGNGDKLYIPAGGCSVTGGGLSKGTATGGDLSGGGLTAGAGSVTVEKYTTDGTKAGTNISAVTGTIVTDTDGSTNEPTSGYYIAVKTQGKGTVSRAKIDRAAFSQTVTRADIKDAHTAGYIPAKSATTAISSGSETVSLAAGSIDAASKDSNTATKYAYIPVTGASFANTATSGTTYADYSSSAPVLKSGDYLYINAGYTPARKISLAKLVPDGASGATSIKAGMLNTISAYDNDGKLVTGSIPTKVAADITASGKTVTIPSGYYASQCTKDVASGSATTPATSIDLGTGTGSVVSSTGVVSIVVPKATKSVTPTVSAGYVSSGTAGTITVNGKTFTYQLPTVKAASTITPKTTDQTIDAGTYLTGTQTIKGDANLVAGNIKSGTSIFGVAGTYTSDATAAAANIESGKTAYVNGTKITGTANKATVTVSGTEMTITGGLVTLA